MILSSFEVCDARLIDADEKHLTLNQVFRSLKLTAYDLSIDTLDMHV
jgi:AMP deaminase